MGWPGGASGFRIPSKTGRASFFAFLPGELFLGISRDSFGPDHPAAEVSGMLPPHGASVNILQTLHGKPKWADLFSLELAANWLRGYQALQG